MPFDFLTIDRCETITKEDFIQNYFKPQKPLVVSGLAKCWGANKLWNVNYLKEIAGHLIVPLFDDRPVDASLEINEPIEKMSLVRYLELLEREPSSLRIFLYNILKHAPELQKDLGRPNLGLKIINNLPMLFMGGTNSKVFMHYDIDLANIFHFNFIGSKQCVLVSPDQTRYMYKIPHAVICREDINFESPDLDRFPALKKIQPLKTNLAHGEMLYMPEGYWHYMKYLSPSASISLRSVPQKPVNLLRAVNNIFVQRHYDNFMRKWKGQKWISYKNEKAIKNTHKFLQGNPN